MKELTRTYSELLSDKRVKSEQNKYEAFSRQRGSVMTKYKKVHQVFLDLRAGLERAQNFYTEMQDTVDSLSQNVEAFVSNRRSEGGQLLNAIETAKAAGLGAQGDRDRDRMRDLMARMSMNPSSSPAPPQQTPQPSHGPSPLPSTPSYNTSYGGTESRNMPRYPQQQSLNGHYGTTSPHHGQPSYGHTPSNGGHGYPPSTNSQPRDAYNPNMYGQISPPAHQQTFSPPPNGQYGAYYPQTQPGQHPVYSNAPAGFVPPPPPPGGPPQQDYSSVGYAMGSSGPGGYAQDPRRQQQHQHQQQPKAASGDPWAGLNAWK